MVEKKTEHSELIILTICGASEESKRFVSHLVRNLVSFNKTRQLELVKIVVLFFRFYCPENSETNVALSRSSMPPLFSLRKHTFFLTEKGVKLAWTMGLSASILSPLTAMI